MITDLNNFVNESLGSSFALPAHGWVGARATSLLLAAHFALLAEIRRAETRSGVNRAFLVQKRFELRSAIATNQDISNFQRKGFARSPRLRRVSLRKKPCISELNRKVGQIQIQFFGKANGGSELQSNSQMKFVSNFFRFLPKAKIQSKFLIPRFCAVGAMAKGD